MLISASVRSLKNIPVILSELAEPTVWGCYSPHQYEVIKKKSLNFYHRYNKCKIWGEKHYVGRSIVTAVLLPILVCFFPPRLSQKNVFTENFSLSLKRTQQSFRIYTGRMELLWELLREKGNWHMVEDVEAFIRETEEPWGSREWEGKANNLLLLKHTWGARITQNAP